MSVIAPPTTRLFQQFSKRKRNRRANSSSETARLAKDV